LVQFSHQRTRCLVSHPVYLLLYLRVHPRQYREANKALGISPSEKNREAYRPRPCAPHPLFWKDKRPALFLPAEYPHEVSQIRVELPFPLLGRLISHKKSISERISYIIFSSIALASIFLKTYPNSQGTYSASGLRLAF